MSIDGDAMAVVDHNGTVLYIPPATMVTDCPYDETSRTATCSMKFGSWTFDGFKLDPSFFYGVEDVDLDAYIPSNKWKLTSTSAKKNTKFYPCCAEPYPDITFTMDFVN